MKIGIVSIMILIIVVVGYFLIPQKINDKVMPMVQIEDNIPDNDVISSESVDVDYKAKFAIYTQGIKRIFTASMYHNLSTDVFIESSNPNIVNIRKSNKTWDDFFKTLPMVLTATCLTTGTGETFCSGQNGELRFFINGIEDPQALNREIFENDQLLVTFGKETQEQISNQISSIDANL